MKKIIVGKIINTRGIKGELKVDATNNESFDRDVVYYIEGYEEDFFIEKASKSGNFSYIKLKNYDNINDVLKFKTRLIYINEDDLEKLEENEYYVKDLLGINVFDESGNEVGVIADVITNSANDVYVIKTESQEVLVPAVKEFIKKIDLENNTMVVKFIEGMIDED